MLLDAEGGHFVADLFEFGLQACFDLADDFLLVLEAVAELLRVRRLAAPKVEF